MLETTPALFHLGPLAVGTTVLTTWGIMIVLSLGAWLASRRLRLDPGPFQVALEGVVQTIHAAFQEGGTEAFRDTWYWSSSQRSAYSAFGMPFGGGYQRNLGKIGELRVRPVRRFFI